MAVYKTDLRDIEFNLFEDLKVQDLGQSEVDEIKQIISEYDKFVENEIYPTRQVADEEGVTFVEGKVKVPQCFHGVKQAVYENGWFALGISEELGGMPAPTAVEVAASSLSCGANVSWEIYPSLSKSAFRLISELGSPAQKEKYLENILSGSWGGTMCLTEPGAGSDVGALTTKATPISDGKYKISGVKIFITSGESDLYDNNVHLVLARTPDSEEGIQGISLFVIPRFRINEDGSVGDSNDVVCHKIEHKMGLHASATCELTFGENDNCIGELIGKEGEGIQNMFFMMNEVRLMCGMQSQSQGCLAYELTRQYTKERVQFGTEIANLPDVRTTLLKMRSIARSMRSITLYIAYLIDLFEKEKNSEIEDEISLLTPVCKAWCTDEGFNISVDAVQMHGGYGYCSEYGIEQFVRDTKIATIYEGTNGIQSIDLVTRKILKDKGRSIGMFLKKMKGDLKASSLTSHSETINHQIEKLEKVLEYFSKQQDINIVLQHTTQFLQMFGNLVASWRLFVGASMAAEKISSVDKQDQEFYQSKIDDLEVFSHLKLSENSGIHDSILNSKFNITKMEL